MPSNKSVYSLIDPASLHLPHSTPLSAEKPERSSSRLSGAEATKSSSHPLITASALALHSLNPAPLVTLCAGVTGHDSWPCYGRLVCPVTGCAFHDKQEGLHGGREQGRRSQAWFLGSNCGNAIYEEERLTESAGSLVCLGHVVYVPADDEEEERDRTGD